MDVDLLEMMTHYMRVVFIIQPLVSMEAKEVSYYQIKMKQPLVDVAGVMDQNAPRFSTYAMDSIINCNCM